MPSDVTQRIAAASATLVTPASYAHAAHEAAQVGNNAQRAQQVHASHASGRHDDTSRALQKRDVVDSEKEQEKSHASDSKEKPHKTSNHSSGKRSIAVA